jgi:4-hydroxy-tetrahydrodipicolinate synthase
MLEDGLTGRVAEARARAVALLPVALALFAEPNPAVIRGVLHAQGKLPAPDVRLPLTGASTAAVEDALAAIAGTTPAGR